MFCAYISPASSHLNFRAEDKPDSSVYCPHLLNLDQIALGFLLGLCTKPSFPVTLAPASTWAAIPLDLSLTYLQPSPTPLPSPPLLLPVFYVHLLSFPACCPVTIHLGIRSSGPWSPASFLGVAIPYVLQTVQHLV